MWSLVESTINGSAVLSLAGIGPLAAFLAAAVWHDLRDRTVPNAIVLAGAAVALLLHALLPAGLGFAGAVPGGLGLLKSLAGMGLGFAALMPLYLLRGSGAGDVKLMAMVGAYLGPVDILGAVFATFVTGAVLALLTVAATRTLGQAVRNIRLIGYGAAARMAGDGPSLFDPQLDSAASIPYALAIALGTGAWLVARLFLLN